MCAIKVVITRGGSQLAEDRWIDRVARSREQDFIVFIQERSEDDVGSCRCAGSDEHLVSAGRCSQARRIIGDCLSGFGKAGRVRVAGEAIFEGTDDWFDDVFRRAKAINLWIADVQINDLASSPG